VETGSESEAARSESLPGTLDDRAHRPLRVFLLERDQQIDHLRGNPARVTEVAAGLGLERIEAAAAIAL
jgi:hypothetical protein